MKMHMLYGTIRYVRIGGAKQVSASSARSDETRKYSDASRLEF